MFNVILLEPEIPQNTGNIIRLCANTGCALHLVRPLGFAWDDRRLKRAGLDYAEWAQVQLHDSLAACLQAAGLAGGERLFAMTTRGERSHTEVAWQPGDGLLFGAESRGLPAPLLAGMPGARKVRIPMLPASRSLNLANSVAVAVYEGWRQQGFSVLPPRQNLLPAGDDAHRGTPPRS